MNENRSTEIYANAVHSESRVQAAIDALKLGDFQARWEASKLLSNSGTAAIEPLLSILEEEDTDWELLWFVARILGNIEHPSAVSGLVNLLATTAHEEVAGMAAAALAHHGTAAIAPLTNLLQQDATRLMAVQALAQIRHADAVPPLLTMVSDAAPATRTAAIEALSHFYTPAISAVLLTVLEDVAATVRKAAVVGLGIQAAQMDTADLVERLQERLRDFHLDVCCQAAIALGRIGTNQAADALFEVLQSPHTPVALQIEAVRALARMDTPHALDRLQSLLKQFVAAANSESALAHNALTLAPDVQQEIITVLGRVESPETQAQATQILLDTLHAFLPVLSPKHKQTIALSLGQLGQRAAIDALIHLLADPNASVRFHAIAALKQLDLQQSYQRLCEYANHSDLDESLKQGITIALQEWTN
jgi:HEAT repeat protein